MGRLLAIGLLVAAVGVAVIVVNGPGTDKPEEVEAAAPERKAPRTQAAAPEEDIAPTDRSRPGVRVRMRKLRFTPGEVSVQAGQPVLFVNDDNVDHTVLQDLGATSGKTAAVDSARIEPGQTFTFTPKEDGEIPFVCTLHPTVMQGQILVEPDAT